MADYMAAEIRIGGKLPRSKVRELWELADDCGAGFEAGDSIGEYEEFLETLEELSGEDLLVLVDDDARYGEFPYLEKFCRANALSYLTQAEGKYEHNACQTWWPSATLGVGSCSTSQEGIPTIEIDRVRACMKRGTPEEQLEAIEGILSRDTPISPPPLELIN